ncbi:MAG: hypothetical protein GC166_03230 [Alphaproteobacteria bacterium]|nr:hypothetical protein [Alphaproteobacteria bacterium]
MAAQPVDLEHLARYTGGDAALNAEILGLFDGQVSELMDKLARAGLSGDRKTWHDIAHSLKGAARGIGAFSFADQAARAEAFDPTHNAREATAIFTLLKAQGEIVSAFIRTYLGR